MDDINDIVSFKSGGSEAAKAEPVVETPAEPKVVEAAPTAAQERDESGKFKAKAEAEKPVENTEPTTVSERPVEQKKDSVSALIAMRQRLQAAENRVRELEAGKTEKPDIFTEPEKAVQELVAQQVAPIKAKFFTRSVQDAEKAHDDFGAAYSNFEKLMDANPALLLELREAEDPGEFIYLVGSNTPEHREAMAAKHRETVSAKDAEIAALKAENEALKKSQTARSDVPESLNRQPSGAIPDRDSDSDISKIVRFKSS